MGASDPIGVFDSGVGGLTVLQAMRRVLPSERFLYLGDTARLPYGTKSAETVRRYAVNATAHLVRRGVKLLVVACNTATSYALADIAAAVEIPVVGVVRPGVEAALATGARRIGVVGTEGTVASGAYQRALAEAVPGAEVRAVACPLFVSLAEEGWGDHPVTDLVAREYLAPLLEWGAEAIILGCTHYPLLLPSLRGVAGPKVKLGDSATVVSEAVRRSSFERAPAGPGAVHLLLTDGSEHFLRVARTILGGDPAELELVHLNGAGVS